MSLTAKIEQRGEGFPAGEAHGFLTALGYAVEDGHMSPGACVRLLDQTATALELDWVPEAVDLVEREWAGISMIMYRYESAIEEGWATEPTGFDRVRQAGPLGDEVAA